MNFTEYFDKFENHLSYADRQSPIHVWRLKQRSLLESLPLPTQKNEAWKYTSLKKLYDSKFSLANTSTINTSEQEHYHQGKHLCFNSIYIVNGEFAPALSDKSELPTGITLTSLNEMLQTNHKTIVDWLTEFSLPETNEGRDNNYTLYNHYFSLFNNTILRNGLVINVEGGTLSDKPIHIIHLNNKINATNTLSSPHVFINIEKGAQITVIEEYKNDSANFCNSVTDIMVHEGARLEYNRVQNDHNETINIGTTRITQKQDSLVEAFAFSCGASLSRHNLLIKLMGENARVQANGLYLVKDQQHIDNHTEIDHWVPNTTSRQLYKGLIDNQARAVFDGRITIHKGAQKSDTAQLNGNLLLSQNAEVDSKPNLEILADDVKATHGSAMGKLSEEEIFYFLSRGITKSKAIEMLSFGYVGETLDKISNTLVKKYLEAILKKSFLSLSVGG